MGTVLLAIVGNVAELATESFQFCFGVVPLEFISASDLRKRNHQCIKTRHRLTLTLSKSAALVWGFSAGLLSWSDRGVDCDLEGDGMAGIN